ncbi:multidrug transporter subunit MdtD [Acinetobacter terrae]|uniref:multidrug transporter subunit MdtD n=1 Tax=Acinetobacter terrae TaxID=2731247 RepID=UPI000A533572|nr:multidrug transporter subunit MdtD [Acinetobacter terrae]
MEEHDKLQPQYRVLVLLASIGFFMQALDTTIIFTALPAIAESLNENPLDIHGVIIGYVLAVAAGIPLSGWLADKFGLKNTYFTAILIFTVASLGCGLSQNLDQLIGFRILQGVGGALLMPVARLALLKIIPRTQFVSAISTMNISGLIGPLVGPALGGWLVKVASWHWIFWVNVPIGLVGLFFTLKVMPNITEKSVKKFDLSGFFLLLITMVGIVLSIEMASNPQSSILFIIGIMTVSASAAFIYAYHAHLHEQALFRAELFKNKLFTVGVLGNLFARLGGNSLPFLLPLMLQIAFGVEPFMAGLMMTPLVLGSLFSKPITRPIIQALGYRRFLVLNSVLVGLCIASFSLTSIDTPICFRAFHFFVFGILNSLQFVAMNSLTLSELSAQQASSGNSFLSMIMMLSMSIGIALAGTILNFFMGLYGNNASIDAFHSTLLCLGAINIITAFIFSRIPKGISN